MQVIDTHPHMLLQREHLVSWRINWSPKSENIRSLAEELNLGLDSFIFIDDNPVECAEVRANLPEVLTVQIPEDETEIPTLLDHLWALDHIKVTEADHDRTRQYRENAQRHQVREISTTLGEFINSLQLEVEISALTPSEVARFAQLTQRTNQFNATTLRMSEREVKQLLDSSSHHGITIQVKDRFGDYGQVGAVLYRIRENTLEVDNLLLSCRVLGRGVEYQVMAALGRMAERHGCSYVGVSYSHTEKNQPVYDFLRVASREAPVTDVEGTKKFLWRAAEAANFSYQPDAQVNQVKSSKDTGVPSGVKNSHSQLEKIASRYGNIKVIHDAIESFLQQSQDKGATPQRSFRAPGSSKELTIAQLFAELLPVKGQVGADDNFFELGGDSIIGIQLISRARQKGWLLTPDDIFAHPTVSGLATRARPVQQTTLPQEPVTGPVFLTPIQQWSFNQQSRQPHHFHQYILLEGKPGMDAVFLQQALEQVVAYHDTLGLRYRQDGSEWHQAHVEQDIKLLGFYTTTSALTTAAPSSQGLTEAYAPDELKEGPLVKAWFHSGNDRSQLCLSIHHLVVDGVSWRVLIEDLELAYQQLVDGQEIQLHAKTTPFQTWATLLNDYASTQAVTDQLPFWENQLKDGPEAQPLGKTLPDDYLATDRQSHCLKQSLGIEETSKLTGSVNNAYNTRIDEVLLTALLKAHAQLFGRQKLQVELESHGRFELFPDVDLSRTVGWFTALYPVSLSMSSTEEIGDLLKSVKEQLRQVPNGGIGYGLLRYMHPEAELRETLTSYPAPAISFNYLGQLHQDSSTEKNRWFDLRAQGLDRPQDQRRPHIIEFIAAVHQGRLTLECRYDQQLYTTNEIQDWLSETEHVLYRIITHCTSHQAGGATPSDFPDAGLDQQELDELLEFLKP